MSEASKTVETAKKASDSTARSSQAAIDAVGKATKETISETSQAAQDGGDHGKEASQKVTETVAETAGAAAQMSAKAAEQSREVMMMGMRTVADIGSRVADISFGRGHHVMASTVQAMDVYRDATERSAERAKALFSSAMIVGRGWQQMQKTLLEMVDYTMENAAHKPQDLLRCENIVGLAEVQRDLYLGAVNHAFESTTRLLDLAGRMVQDAARPLQSHHH
jgi:hypothetical protein